ncbi:hypothetical protein [Mesorhizobium sp. M0130]|uniref:hypothetical protein n=1 Tax=Mesorhizobium sp. M0130 TaxID=2956887 RepID=UPI0033352701
MEVAWKELSGFVSSWFVPWHESANSIPSKGVVIKSVEIATHLSSEKCSVCKTSFSLSNILNVKKESAVSAAGDNPSLVALLNEFVKNQDVRSALADRFALGESTASHCHLLQQQ